MSEDRERKIESIGERVEDNKSSGFSNKIKNKLFSTLITWIKNNIIKYKNPKEYFQKILDIAEFKWLEKMVKDTDGIISWDKLAKRWVVRIKNKKVKWIYWKWDLDLRWTRIKTLWKLKKISWWLSCKNVETLEDIWNLEEVWESLKLQWTRVKTLWKLKKVDFYLNCNHLKTLEDLWELEYVWWWFWLERTSIKTLWKLKKVWLSLICEGSIFLESLWELEEVWTNSKDKLWEPWSILEHLYLSGTKVRSLWKLKKVNGRLDCSNIKELEDFGNLEEVGETIYIMGTSSKLQIEILEMTKTWKLISSKVIFGWNIEGIEELLEQKKIPWDLSVIWLSVDKQLEVIQRIKIWKLKVDGTAIFGWDIEWKEKLLEQEEKVNWDEVLREGALGRIPWSLSAIKWSFWEQIEVKYRIQTWRLKVDNVRLDKKIEEMFFVLYKNNRLNLKAFRKMFGEDINRIEDKEQKKYAIKILSREYEEIKVEIKEKIEKIVKENEWKELAEEEKGNIRKQILGLDRELKRKRGKIESFGIKL